MSKCNMTLAQMGHIVRLFEKKGVTESQYRELTNSGLLTDLLDTKEYQCVDRKAFQALLKASDNIGTTIELTEEVKRIAVPTIARFSWVEWLQVKKFPIAYIAPPLTTRWGEQVEVDTPAATAIVRCFKKRARFDKIWKSLDNPEELTAGQIFWLIEHHYLRSDGKAVLFKVDDFLVVIGWYGGGWSFYVNSLTNPDDRGDGDWLFFRDSGA